MSAAAKSLKSGSSAQKGLIGADQTFLLLFPVNDEYRKRRVFLRSLDASVTDGQIAYARRRRSEKSRFQKNNSFFHKLLTKPENCDIMQHA